MHVHARRPAAALLLYLHQSRDRAGDPVAEAALQEVSGQDAGEDGGQSIGAGEVNCKHCKMPLKETRGDTLLCPLSN